METKLRIGRHDNPGEKRAEERVDADDLSEQRRRKNQDQHGHDDAGSRSRCMIGAGLDEMIQPRFDQEAQGRDKGQSQEDRYDGGFQAAGFHNGHHQGETAPGRQIADGGARQGQAAQRRRGQAALLEDAGEHRKGGEAHGDSHE